jgi:hypothetical protein
MLGVPRPVYSRAHMWAKGHVVVPHALYRVSVLLGWHRTVSTRQGYNYTARGIRRRSRLSAS